MGIVNTIDIQIVLKYDCGRACSSEKLKLHNVVNSPVTELCGTLRTWRKG